MNFRFTLLSYLAFLLFLGSCTNEQNADTNSNKITATTSQQTFTNFYVRYLEDDQELKAEAIFKIGDSLKTATAQAIQSVSFENTPMTIKDLGKNGIRYRSKKSGQSFKEKYTFNAQLDSKISIDYPLSINTVNSFSIKEKQVRRSKGVTITWDGTPLVKGELLVVFFVNPDKKPVSFTINGPTNKSEVFLEAKNLSRLKAGEGKLRLIRKVLNRLDEAPQNIESVIEYYTRPINIIIAE
ncbi:MAG: hypothetical protein AB8G15_03235 [Saprospiraceae bacterium]